MKHLAPDYVYAPRGLQANMIVSISDDGHITSITPREEINLGAQFIEPLDILEISPSHEIVVFPDFLTDNCGNL